VTLYTEGFGRSFPPQPLRLLPAGTKAAGWDYLHWGIAPFHGAPQS